MAYRLLSLAKKIENNLLSGIKYGTLNTAKVFIHDAISDKNRETFQITSSSNMIWSTCSEPVLHQLFNQFWINGNCFVKNHQRVLKNTLSRVGQLHRKQIHQLMAKRMLQNRQRRRRTHRRKNPHHRRVPVNRPTMTGTLECSTQINRRIKEVDRDDQSVVMGMRIVTKCWWLERLVLWPS